MHDEDRIRRQISIVQNRLQRLSGVLADHAETSDPVDFDDQEIAAELQVKAWNAADEAVHLLRVLLSRDPALARVLSSFNADLPNDLLDFSWEDIGPDIRFATFPIATFLNRYFEIGVAALGEDVPAEQLETLDRICENLGKTIDALVKSLGLTAPTGETPVKKLGYILIRSVFPGALSDGNVSFQLKHGQVRKPDAAIPSLRTCIEFKFADSTTSLGKALDELTADISAYGDARYSIFRGVVYAVYQDAASDLTEMWKERQKKFKSKKEWDIFVVVGLGARSRRLRKIGN